MRQLDQVRGSVEVAAGHRVADRLGRVAVLLVPETRPPVQIGNVVGLLVQQACSQHVGKQMVIAVPVASIVERDQEQIPSLDRLERGLAAVLAGDRIAQGAGQPAQDGGLQQEVPKVFGLTLQDLFDQVVDDVAVIPGEPRDESGDVVSALHRQCRQLDRRDPAFGTHLERCDIRRRQFEPHHAVEVRRGLVGREAQVGGADLDEFAPPAQPRERQRGIGAAGEHQVDLRGKVLQQMGHSVLDLARLDDVVVVEHQDDVVRDCVEVVQQGVEDRLDGRLMRLQERVRTRGDPGRCCLERGDKVWPEQPGIVVALVERKPRRGVFVGRSRGQPLRQQGRLPEPGWSRHQRQRRLGHEVQTLHQPRTRSSGRGAA